jgi:hypothetical protein
VVRNVGTNTKEASKKKKKQADASTQMRTLPLGGETNTSLSVRGYLSRYSQLRTIFIHYADALQFFSPLTRTGRVFVTKQEQPSTHFS